MNKGETNINNLENIYSKKQYENITLVNKKFYD